MLQIGIGKLENVQNITLTSYIEINNMFKFFAAKDKIQGFNILYLSRLCAER